VESYELATEGINQFLSSLKCSNGKRGYYRALRAFYNWLYRNHYVKQPIIDKANPPKPSRELLPCLSKDLVQYLIDQTETIRDKAIISLFADSGIRLNQLVHIKLDDIDFENNTVTIMDKGNKQRKPTARIVMT
jgi:integrase/recombinase XerC